MLPPVPSDRENRGHHPGTGMHSPHPGRPARSSEKTRQRTRRAAAAIRYLTASYYLLDTDHDTLAYVVPALIVDAFIHDITREGWATMQEDLERAIDNGWIAALPDGYRLTTKGLHSLQET